MRVQVFDRSTNRASQSLFLPTAAYSGGLRVAFSESGLDDGGGIQVRPGVPGYDTGRIMPQWGQIWWASTVPGIVAEVIVDYMLQIPESLGEGWSIGFGE